MTALNEKHVIEGTHPTGYIKVLYDVEGNLYDTNGNLLEPEYEARWMMFKPYDLHLSNTHTQDTADTDARYWPLGMWPKHPDMDEDEGDPAQIEYIVEWMRAGYDDAVRRYLAADISEDEEQDIINWGSQDPYFGPLMRGYANANNDQLAEADRLHDWFRWHLVETVQGSQDFPDFDGWGRIYNEIMAR